MSDDKHQHPGPCDAHPVDLRATAHQCYGLVNGPITLYAWGEISASRMRECIGEWVDGKREWLPADFDMAAWPDGEEPSVMRDQVAALSSRCIRLAKAQQDGAQIVAEQAGYIDQLREQRHAWKVQCDFASEAQADAVSRLATESRKVERIAAIYNGWANGNDSAARASRRALAEIGEALGKPWEDTPSSVPACGDCVRCETGIRCPKHRESK